MNPNLKKILLSTGAVAVVIGGVIAGWHFGTALMGNIVGDILKNIAASKIEKAKLEKIKSYLAKGNLSELNHDLEKLIIEALSWTVKNTKELYLSYCINQEQKNKLNQLTDEMIKKIKSTDTKDWDQTNQILNQVNGLEDVDEMFDQFSFWNEDWPEINPDYPLDKFFKDNFIESFRICFGELLKSPERNSALISYNRNISNQIQRNLITYEKQLDKITSSNEELKSLLQNLKGRSKRQVEKEIVLPALNENLEIYLSELHHKVDLLVDISEKTYVSVEEVKKESRFQTQLIGRLDDKVGKDYRNRLLLFTILPLIAISLGVLVNQLIVARQPINFSIQIEDKKPNPQLPFEVPEITISYLDKTEKLIAVNNEVVLKGIPSAVRGDRVRIQVQTYGFEKVDTSFILRSSNINIPIFRDDTYATINGFVKDHQSGQRVSGATIRLLDLSIESDSNGNFHLNIPEKYQSTEQRIEITKIGYKPWVRNEPVFKASETIVHLVKDSD